MTANGAKRVAITGMGAITPLGLDVRSTWESCRAGHSGIGLITLFDTTGFPTKIAGEVKGFDAVKAVGHKEARRSSRCIQLALVAAREAIADSGLDVAALSDEVGVLVASGIGGLEFLDRASIALHDHGVRRVSPFTIPGMIPDMPAGMIAIEHGAKGQIGRAHV